MSASNNKNNGIFMINIYASIIFRVGSSTAVQHSDILFIDIPLIYLDCKNDIHNGKETFSIVAQFDKAFRSSYDTHSM